MKLVKAKDLKVGQVVLFGDLDGDKFEVAEVREVSVHFKNWENIDMTIGNILKRGDGLINLVGTNGAVKVLSSAEVIEVNKMKNKILMLKELKE